MNRNLIIELVLVIILVVTVTFYLYKIVVTPEVDIEVVKNIVVEHLSSKSYHNTDYEIDVSYNWESKLFGYNPYSVKVIFNDKLNVVCEYKYYYKSESKEVIQSGVSPMDAQLDKNFKHTEQE